VKYKSCELNPHKEQKIRKIIKGGKHEELTTRFKIQDSCFQISTSESNLYKPYLLQIVLVLVEYTVLFWYHFLCVYVCFDFVAEKFY